MKAYEFMSRLNPNNTVDVPTEVAALIEQPQALRVILLTNESNEENAWNRLTTEQFFRGYDEGDAIYDSLSSR